MSKFIKSAVAAAVVSATLAASFSTQAHAGRNERLFFGGLAAGIVGTAIIAHERRKYRERHYTPRVHYRDCFWKKRKVWSEYRGRYIWKRVKVCH